MVCMNKIVRSSSLLKKEKRYISLNASGAVSLLGQILKVFRLKKTINRQKQIRFSEGSWYLTLLFKS